MANAGPLKVKVVLLGEGAVGKTSIVLRYIENKFNEKHLSTLQVSRSADSQRVWHVKRARDWTFGCVVCLRSSDRVRSYFTCLQLE